MGRTTSEFRLPSVAELADPALYQPGTIYWKAATIAVSAWYSMPEPRPMSIGEYRREVRAGLHPEAVRKVLKKILPAERAAARNALRQAAVEGEFSGYTIRLGDRGLYLVSGPFNRFVVDRLKAIPRSEWHPSSKVWTVPETKWRELEKLIKVLPELVEAWAGKDRNLRRRLETISGLHGSFHIRIERVWIAISGPYCPELIARIKQIPGAWYRDQTWHVTLERIGDVEELLVDLADVLTRDFTMAPKPLRRSGEPQGDSLEALLARTTGDYGAREIGDEEDDWWKPDELRTGYRLPAPSSPPAPSAQELAAAAERQRRIEEQRAEDERLGRRRIIVSDIAPEEACGRIGELLAWEGRAYVVVHIDVGQRRPGSWSAVFTLLPAG